MTRLRTGGPLLLLFGGLLVGCGDRVTESVEPTEFSSPAPVLHGITPELLAPGVEAVVTGAHFGAVRTRNRVFFGADEAQVLEASETRLRVRLASWTCHPEGPIEVRVEVDGRSGETRSHPFSPGEPIVLNPGEQRRIASPAARCLVLPASTQVSEYLIGVQSTTQLTGPRTLVRLRGVGEPAPGGIARAESGPGTAAGRFGRHPASPHPATPHEDVALHLHREAEIGIRSADARIVESATPLRPGGRGVVSAGSPATRAAPGDTVLVRIPDITAQSSCQTGRAVRAFVAHVGTHARWLVDIRNPPGGLTAEDISLLAGEFDREIHPELVSWFGEPTDIDGSGGVTILITQELNRMSGAALGFVSTSDFFDCPGGNRGEFIYFRAPDPTGSVTTPAGESKVWPRASAMRTLPILIGHEMTHLIQMGRRFHLPPFADSPQAAWLLEAQATLAEELLGYRYTGLQARSALGPETAFGSFAPTGTRWFANPLADLSTYVGLGFDAEGYFRVQGAPEECSWLAISAPGPCSTGRIAYGVGWTLLRWLSDHFGDDFPGGERELQQRIVDSPSSGFSTLAGVLGRPIQGVLAPWAATLYTDGRIPHGPPILGFPSWDLRAIEAAMEAEYGHSLLLAPTIPFGDSERTTRMAAGSTAYFRLEAPFGHPGYALSARAPSGATLGSYIQLWIVRLR